MAPGWSLEREGCQLPERGAVLVGRRRGKKNNIAWAIIVRAPTRRWKLLENLLKIVEAMLRCERKK